MDLLAEAVTTFVRTHGPDQKYLLAYSGGLDSHVLLHLFATLRSIDSFHLRAMYVNHGISSHADKWAEHCRAICRELHVEFIQQTIRQTSELSNLEERLRRERYQLFQDNLFVNEILLTAHHQNDQAETILLQLCRGAGLPGLAAMPRMKVFGKGFHARPLLDMTRDDLHHYATRHELNWIEDESNANRFHTRNFLRHEVIPILAKHWPSVTKTLARAAENCADAQEFMNISTHYLLTKVQGTVSGTLSVKKIRELAAIEQRHVLRAFIHQANFLLPSTVKIQQILQTLLQARDDKMPHVFWGNAEIRRCRDDLFLMRKMGQHDPDQVIPWDISEPLIIPDIGTLEACSFLAHSGHVTVQFRKGGEKLRLSGRKHHHELKKAFQMWGVLPWLRDRIPLVYADGVLVAVVGYWIQEGCIIQLQPNADFATVTP